MKYTLQISNQIYTYERTNVISLSIVHREGGKQRDPLEMRAIFSSILSYRPFNSRDTWFFFRDKIHDQCREFASEEKKKMMDSSRRVRGRKIWPVGGAGGGEAPLATPLSHSAADLTSGVSTAEVTRVASLRLHSVPDVALCGAITLVRAKASCHIPTRALK